MTDLDKKWLAENKAHAMKDLRPLLIPWCMFRVYINLKQEAVTSQYKKNRTVTRYGDEHDCTYKQCLAGHVRSIVMDRLKGYNRLINMIEQGIYKGKYTTARIYGRSPGEQGYNVLHRTYKNGKLDTKNVKDPTPNTSDCCKTLFFFTKNDKLIITETDPETENFKMPE